jgi:hypothetical protein
VTGMVNLGLLVEVWGDPEPATRLLLSATLTLR